MRLLLISVLVVVMIGLMVPSAFAYTITDDATGGDCLTIGTWDSASRTCTLSSNLTEGITFGSSNITLDGNGYSITGDGNDAGISSVIKVSITIKNLTISNFSDGIIFSDTLNSIIENNTIQGNDDGIQLANSPETLIQNNNIISNARGIISGSSMMNENILD